MTEKLKNMSLGSAVLMGLVFMALYWLLYYDSGEQREALLNKLGNEVKQKQAQVNRLEESLKAARKYEIVEQKMGEILDRIITYIPTKLRSVDILRLIQKEAVLADLNIVKMSQKRASGRPVEGAPFVKLPVSAQLEGDFVRVMEFLSALTKLDKIVTVERMRFSLDNKKRVRFTATFMGYKYVDSSKGRR